MAPTKDILPKLAVLLFASSLIACAIPKQATAEKPQWVTRGSGLFVGPPKVFHGIGIAPSSIKNEVLRKATARNRARAAVAEIGETFVAVLLKGYFKIHSSLPSPKILSLHFLEVAKPADQWVDPSNGTAYALVRVELDEFEDEIMKSLEIRPSARVYVFENADRVFMDLAEIYAKQAP
jgi:hypothetical protein